MTEEPARVLTEELLADPQAFVESGKLPRLLLAFLDAPIENLRPLLRSDNVWVQRAAGFVAAELAERAAPLVNDVLPLLSSNEPHAQSYALKVLAVCSEGPRAEMFAHVVRQLASDDAEIRCQSMDLIALASVAQLEAAAQAFTTSEADGEAHRRGLGTLASVQALPETIVALAGSMQPLLRRYGGIAAKRAVARFPSLAQQIATVADAEHDSLLTRRQHCCERMRIDLAQTCDVHSDRWHCPDALINYCSNKDEYGILVHDGGHSIVTIQFCPWCGTKLPASKRERWFAALQQLGVDPWSDDVPERFQTDAWYRDDEGG